MKANPNRGKNPHNLIAAMIVAVFTLVGWTTEAHAERCGNCPKKATPALVRTCEESCTNDAPPPPPPVVIETPESPAAAGTPASTTVWCAKLGKKIPKKDHTKTKCDVETEAPPVETAVCQAVTDCEANHCYPDPRDPEPDPTKKKRLCFPNWVKVGLDENGQLTFEEATGQPNVWVVTKADENQHKMTIAAIAKGDGLGTCLVWIMTVILFFVAIQSFFAWRDRWRAWRASKR